MSKQSLAICLTDYYVSLFLKKISNIWSKHCRSRDKVVNSPVSNHSLGWHQNWQMWVLSLKDIITLYKFCRIVKFHNSGNPNSWCQDLWPQGISTNVSLYLMLPSMCNCLTVPFYQQDQSIWSQMQSDIRCDICLQLKIFTEPNWCEGRFAATKRPKGSRLLCPMLADRCGSITLGS